MEKLEGKIEKEAGENLWEPEHARSHKNTRKFSGMLL